jgi:predicted anti-sigma-YlaC factor YlaD
VDCAFYRESISARIDGEEHGLEPDALDAHLASCRACRNWAEQASVVTRRARMAPAEAVPDLSALIMDRAADGAGARQAPSV